MIRAALAVLLLCASCTVPSLEELNCDGSDPLTPVDIAGGPPDAVISGKETTCRGVKLTLTYEGFRPGCVRVLAREVGSEKEISKVVENTVTPEDNSLVVAVLPPDDWRSQVTVRAEAFERECSDNPVASDSHDITLTRGESNLTTLTLRADDKDGDGYVARFSGGTDCNDSVGAIHPGAEELPCNDLDDNCDGRSDTDAFQLGQACTVGTNCNGTYACGSDGKVLCSVPNGILAYPDTDGDGHGDKNATATTICGSVPAGFTTGPNDDCDDSKWVVYPGAPEFCDGQDNDCDGVKDEDFPQLNQACTDPGTQCAGTQQCASSGNTTKCVVSQPVPTWYPDDDGDAYGRNAGSVQTCVQPSVAYERQGGDCDDGNPFTSPTAAEICDGLDNDCDSQPENTATVCPGGTATWGTSTEGSGTQIWYSVSTWTPGGVWVTGDNNRRAILKPGDSGFTLTTGGCGNGTTAWYAVWADPNNNGRAYFTSASGRLANQDASSTNCTQVTETGLATHGITGVRDNSILELYGVSDSSNLNEGAAFLWDGTSTSVTFNPASNAITPVLDIHGISRGVLFAAGGYTGSSAGPRIYRYNPADGTWQTQGVQNLGGLSRLNGIFVVTPRLAFAVGDNGSALKWNGTAWSKLTFPNADNLTSVVAFGANSAYATALNGSRGRIYRYNGTDWTLIHELSGTVFHDIAGTSPADLWVVGSTGKILHWPQ